MNWQFYCVVRIVIAGQGQSAKKTCLAADMCVEVVV